MNDLDFQGCRANCNVFKRALLVLVSSALLTGCGPSKAQREAVMAQKVAAKIAENHAAEVETERALATSAVAAAQNAAAMEAEGAKRDEESTIARLKDALLGTLADPSSAQLRDLRLASDGAALCGEVNAKNGFGGYVGFRPFVVHSAGVAVWSGSCRPGGDIDLQLACVRPQLAYVLPARATGCKTQDQIDALVAGR